MSSETYRGNLERWGTVGAMDREAGCLAPHNYFVSNLLYELNCAGLDHIKAAFFYLAENAMHHYCQDLIMDAVRLDTACLGFCRQVHQPTARTFRVFMPHEPLLVILHGINHHHARESHIAQRIQIKPPSLGISDFFKPLVHLLLRHA
jgi:hypothetical protein